MIRGRLFKAKKHLAAMSSHAPTDSVKWGVLVMCPASQTVVSPPHWSLLNHVLRTNSPFCQPNPLHAARMASGAGVYSGTNAGEWERRKEQHPSGDWHHRSCVNSQQSASAHCTVTCWLLVRSMHLLFKQLSVCVSILFTLCLRAINQTLLEKFWFSYFVYCKAESFS